MTSPYELCPTFETESFTLRLVSEEDAEALLSCYSDTEAQKIFNSDRCSGDFCMDKIEDMRLCVKAWREAYSQRDYVRFAIIDTSLSRAIGTVEMFGYVGTYKIKTGILRVDVRSDYEKERYLSELFAVCAGNFFDLFEVDTIATKAIPDALERRNTLMKQGFSEGSVYEGTHYFLLSRQNGPR